MGNFIPNLFYKYIKDGYMKINFGSKRHDFVKYMLTVLDDRGDNRDLICIERAHGAIVVHNIKSDTALELDCEGTKINLYYFHSFTNDAISFCDELDLSDPQSIECVMEWLDKVDNP